jgi:hypothetical protein
MLHRGATESGDSEQFVGGGSQIGMQLGAAEAATASTAEAAQVIHLFDSLADPLAYRIPA